MPCDTLTLPHTQTLAILCAVCQAILLLAVKRKWQCFSALTDDKFHSISRPLQLSCTIHPFSHTHTHLLYAFRDRWPIQRIIMFIIQTLIHLNKYYTEFKWCSSFCVLCTFENDYWPNIDYFVYILNKLFMTTIDIYLFLLSTLYERESVDERKDVL